MYISIYTFSKNIDKTLCKSEYLKGKMKATGDCNMSFQNNFLFEEILLLLVQNQLRSEYCFEDRLYGLRNYTVEHQNSYTNRLWLHGL